MTVYELLEKMNGEICRGRARVRVGGEIIVIGQLNGDYMEFTEAGRKLASPEDSAEIVAETKPKRGRPAKNDVVESAQVTDNLFDIPDAGLT